MKKVYRILVDVIVDEDHEHGMRHEVVAKMIVEAIQKVPVVYFNRRPGPLQVVVNNAFHHDDIL